MTATTHKTKIQPTLSAPTLNKVFARRVKSVFTPMIWPWTGLSRLTCMLIKELNLSWMPLVAKSLTYFQKKKLTRFWAKNSWRWWKEPDRKLCVNFSWKLPRRANTGGNGAVPMGRPANISIVFLLDIHLKRTKQERVKSKSSKSQSSKKLTPNVMNWWVKTRAVLWSLLKSSWSGKKPGKSEKKSKQQIKRRNCKRKRARDNLRPVHSFSDKKESFSWMTWRQQKNINRNNLSKRSQKRKKTLTKSATRTRWRKNQRKTRRPTEKANKSKNLDEECSRIYVYTLKLFSFYLHWFIFID